MGKGCGYFIVHGINDRIDGEKPVDGAGCYGLFNIGFSSVSYDKEMTTICQYKTILYNPCATECV